MFLVLLSTSHYCDDLGCSGLCLFVSQVLGEGGRGFAAGPNTCSTLSIIRHLHLYPHLLSARCQINVASQPQLPKPASRVKP